MSTVTLYKKHASGSIGKWEVASYPEESAICLRWQIKLGGETQERWEEVYTNSSGRDIEEQCQLQLAHRVSKQRDRGYKDTMEEAQLSSSLNQLSLLRAMLAKKLSDIKVSTVRFPVTLQPKLNGVRCLVTRLHTGELVFYTRGGKPHICCDHFEVAFDKLMPGVTLDGELYIHGEKLQTISSITRKKDHPRQPELKLWLYDNIAEDDHLARWSRIFDNVYFDDKVLICPTYVVENLDEALERHVFFVSNGYEGSILRQNNAPYEAGSRSSSLIKIKDFDEKEYMCENIILSDQGVALAILRTPSGKRFEPVVPGTREEKYQTWLNREKYIGRYLTVKYTEMSNDGVPCPTVAVSWRERGV